MKHTVTLLTVNGVVEVKFYKEHFALFSTRISAVGDDGKVMFGKFISKVKILAVKDSAGRAVFDTTTEERSPSQIIFSVTEDIHLLLRKAEYIRNVDIILVPTKASLELDEGENAPITITSEKIKEYIEAQSTTVE